MSKGSKRRPARITRDEEEARWRQTFCEHKYEEIAPNYFRCVKCKVEI